MPKIVQKSVKTFNNYPTLKLFKFDNSNNYYCYFYVGYDYSKNGSVEKSLRTPNLRIAEKSAKELYRNYTEEHSKIKIDRNTNFTKDIADSFFEKRMRNHSARNKNTDDIRKEKLKYENYVAPIFDLIDYTNEEHLQTAVFDLVDECKTRELKDTTISKYMSMCSMMFRYAKDKNKLRIVPDIPTFARINDERPPYFPKELKQIHNRINEEYMKKEDDFFIHLNEYLYFIRNCIHCRPGVAPLMIKKFQCQFIPKTDILKVTLFNTKNKPRKVGTVNTYFNDIYIQMLKRDSNNADDYLFAPNEKNRPRLYERIRKNFVRISSELDLYVRDGKTRPLYAVRHTNAVEGFKRTGNLEVVSDSLNTSKEVLKSNYLNATDDVLIKQHQLLYPVSNNS